MEIWKSYYLLLNFMGEALGMLIFTSWLAGLTIAKNKSNRY